MENERGPPVGQVRAARRYCNVRASANTHKRRSGGQHTSILSLHDVMGVIVLILSVHTDAITENSSNHLIDRAGWFSQLQTTKGGQLHVSLQQLLYTAAVQLSLIGMQQFADMFSHTCRETCCSSPQHAVHAL